jgi:hypothetical protein
MNWLRKLILAVVMGVTMLAPFAAVPQADAQSRAARTYYAVYYRASPEHGWTFYYSFWSYSDAQSYSNWISSYGYQTYIRSVR